MDKFTPSEWWYEEDEYMWQLFGGVTEQTIEVNGIKFDVPSHPRQILKAPKKNTPYAEYWPDEADARLIIAAPKMYDVLSDALQALEDVHGMYDESDSQFVNYERLIKQVKSVLSQVKGV